MIGIKKQKINRIIVHLTYKEGEKKEKTIGDHLITIHLHTPKNVKENIGRVQKGGRRLDLAIG
jgi:hypothetical protein